jgi:hypothetical protein
MWCLSACVGIGAGCQSADSQHQGLEPTYDQASGRLRELSYDSDKDGRVDMKAVMDGSRVLKVEVDENNDGRPDRWEYYEPMGLSPTRIERSTQRDGKVTRTEGFRNGALAWVEEDRDGDGKVDRWETYVDGALSTLALDSQGRGRPDRVVTYGDGDKWKSEKVEE